MMEPRLRSLVWQRANGRCEYCLFPAAFALLPFQIDHIIAAQGQLDGPVLMGKSAIGQVTILVLEINRPGLMAVRRSLMEEGVYPLSPDL
jgi:hypothetical protein